LTTPAHVGWTGGGALLIPLSLGGRGWNGSLWIRFEHVRLLARRGGNWSEEGWKLERGGVETGSRRGTVEQKWY
jgi:hypothetical protein